MVRYYGIALRSQVMKFVRKGGDYAEAVRVFGISRSTLYRWIRRAGEGRLEPIIPQDYASKRISNEALAQYVKTHHDQTLAEMGRHFGMRPYAILYRLKKLRFVNKKKHFCTRSGTKRIALDSGS